ncbi:MAG: hypothetical protein K2N05_10255 [Muribaculaceae bacterium]|nr:hypothetical protein [Muribaculaceae bacterium]
MNKFHNIGRRLAFFFVSLIAMIGFAQKTDWAQFDRYAADNARLREKAEKIEALFFGNSITDSWATMRPGFFSKNNFAGRGISGQSTYQFLSRFREDVVNLSPRMVVINGGTNDIAENTHPYSEDKTFGNIISMVEIAQANGIKVILTSVLPAAGFKWNRAVTDAPEKIEKLNIRLKEYADAHGIPFVNYHAMLLAPDGRSMDSNYSKDGVHPNDAGYVLMEEAVLPVIRCYDGNE